MQISRGFFEMMLDVDGAFIASKNTTQIRHLREGGDPGYGSVRLCGSATCGCRMDLLRQSLCSCRIKSGMTCFLGI